MKLKTLMVIKSIITIVFGVGFVVIPVRVLSLYGVTLDPAKAFDSLVGDTLFAKQDKRAQ